MFTRALNGIGNEKEKKKNDPDRPAQIFVLSFISFSSVLLCNFTFMRCSPPQLVNVWPQGLLSPAQCCRLVLTKTPFMRGGSLATKKSAQLPTRKESWLFLTMAGLPFSGWTSTAKDGVGHIGVRTLSVWLKSSERESRHSWILPRRTTPLQPAPLGPPDVEFSPWLTREPPGKLAELKFT